MSEPKQNPTERSISDSRPPLLIGGVLHTGVSLLKGARIDYLNLSVSAEGASNLRKVCVSSSESGKPLAGFYGQHEWRKTLGGSCGRHWDPDTPSKALGPLNELWVWQGSVADSFVSFMAPTLPLTSSVCSSTRIDIAFDFECDQEYRPVRFGYECKEWIEAQRLGHRPFPADEAFASYYVGSLKSRTKLLRIYRADLKHGLIAPTLRIELELHGELADKLWKADNISGRYRMAAAIIEDMTGAKVVSDIGEVPRLESKPMTEGEESVCAMIEIWAGALHECIEAGVDLGRLVELQIEKQSRMSSSRRRKKFGGWKDRKAAELTDSLAERLTYRREMRELARAPANMEEILKWVRKGD